MQIDYMNPFLSFESEIIAEKRLISIFTKRKIPEAEISAAKEYKDKK